MDPRAKPRAPAAVDPRALPGALTRDVNTRLSTAEMDPQTKPALIRFANEDCKAWGPCRRPGCRGGGYNGLKDQGNSHSNLATLKAFLKMRSVEVDNLPDHFLV
ncbi:MAG: hypothetical protein Q8O91_01940 [Candidatus Aminicenantes bacterium]|nr:hypothetical protein [Candidatus Aminicenantes bacterium]